MQNFKIWLLIFVAIVVAYGASLRYGFSQDDWFFLLISRANNFGDVLNFFNPASQSGFAFFRPLGTQLYFYLFQDKPVAMHVFMLFVQSLNGFLVMRLVERLKVKSPVPVMVGVLYAISSVHFLSLYYIAATQQLLAASFSLLSLIFFLERKYRVSAILFVMALLSKETAIVVPGVAVVLILVNKLKPSLKAFLPYAFVFASYLLLRLTTSATVQSEYHLSFGPSILTNIRWYYLFAANFPEQLVSYGLPRMGINLTQFIADYGLSAWTILVNSSLIALFTLARLLKTRRWLYIIWFVIALGPVILLRNHLYPHYLDLALIPFLLLLTQDLKLKTQYYIFAIYALTALFSIQFSQVHHWTTGRARMSTNAQSKLDWREICTHESIAFVGEGRRPLELSYTLSIENGPRVICQNNSLKVQYGGTIPGGSFIVPIDRVFK